ncbi:DUF6924 domain-containing protein [Phycicoccus flavus]|uniref:DUF6924 domain-containing protein n=1 Tax=Phycicoccus flavus TaxID=2502783 RepID=UPI000FEBF25A|nr:hypothetical protein [Phycicoccus flavus]NHA69415.1 hypothetical protein [Phycicoccus flavus]
MTLPPAPDLGCLLVRTDYSSDEAWTAALEDARAVHDDIGSGALLEPLESPELDGLGPDDLFQVAVADAQTMRDCTLIFVDLHPGEDGDAATFRCTPEQVEGVVANLTLSNMDFHEYADAADEDGVFRGF